MSLNNLIHDADTGHVKGCAFGRTARCTCMYIKHWDKSPAYTAPAFAPTLEYGLTAREAADLIPDGLIFQQLIREVADRQIRHEEEQLREWLRALIDNPAGRKLIEELL